jgi:hypothetical protein
MKAIHMLAAATAVVAAAPAGTPRPAPDRASTAARPIRPSCGNGDC